jgi:broad specificity phosphatase PhoE
MPTRLVLVCQAATAALRQGRFPADEPLDASALAACGRLRPPAAGTAWASPARAARETALALGLEARLEPALRDLDHGAWSGRRLADIAVAEPVRLAAWLADPAAAATGGEAFADLFARAGPWLDARRDEPGTAIAIAPAMVIRALVLWALAAPPASGPHLDVPPLSLTLLTCQAGRWRLRLGGPGEG